MVTSIENKETDTSENAQECRDTSQKPFILTLEENSLKRPIFLNFCIQIINIAGDSFEKTIKVFRLKSYNHTVEL